MAEKKGNTVAEKVIKAKVKFVKPVQGYAYHTDDVATIKIKEKRLKQLVAEKFLEKQ